MDTGTVFSTTYKKKETKKVGKTTDKTCNVLTQTLQKNKDLTCNASIYADSSVPQTLY